MYTPQTDDILKWEETRSIAERVDKLICERVFDPRGGLVRRKVRHDDSWGEYVPGWGSSYWRDRFPDLTADITTPFPIKFPAEPKEKRLLHHVEFAYYNEGPSGEYLFEPAGPPVETPYRKRYYSDNTRQPVQYGCFITDERNNPINQADLFKGDDINEKVPYDVYQYLTHNLMESKRHQLYKQWPVLSHYSTNQCISAELFFITDPGFPYSCSAIVRPVPVNSMDGCHNGNGNGKARPAREIAGGGLDGRPYRACGRVYTFGQYDAMAFASRNWDYIPEYYGKRNIDGDMDEADLYPMPPVCSGCVDVSFSYMGLEAGIHAYLDGSNFSDGEGDDTSFGYNYVGERPCTLWTDQAFGIYYYGSRTKPGTVVAGWDPMLKEGDGDYTKDKYRVKWCHPDDVDAYERVSRYERWEFGHTTAVVRLTPLRFHRDEVVEGELKTTHYNFVWMPTAFVFEYRGKLVPAVRRRWYDMLLYRIKYLCGYWNPNTSVYEAVNCIDSASYGFTGVPIDWPNKKAQSWNGDPDEPGPEIEHPCGEQIDKLGHGVEDLSDEMPTGVTWDYRPEGVWNPLEMQCARWLFEDLGWGDVEGVSAYCRSYFGTRYFESMVGAMNVKSVSEGLPAPWYPMDGVGFSFDNNMALIPGGACTTLQPDLCGDTVMEYYKNLRPWWGDCSNTTCSNGDYNVHAYTMRKLQDFLVLAEMYKHVEEPTGWCATDAWKTCFPATTFVGAEKEWEWGRYYRLEYYVSDSASEGSDWSDWSDQSGSMPECPCDGYLYKVYTDEQHSCLFCDSTGCFNVFTVILKQYGQVVNAVEVILRTESMHASSTTDILAGADALGLFAGRVIFDEHQRMLTSASPAPSGCFYSVEIRCESCCGSSGRAMQVIALDDCDSLANHVYANGPVNLSSPEYFEKGMDDVLNDAVDTLTASSMNSGRLASLSDCSPWHEEVHGGWKYYWCEAYQGYTGNLPYALYSFVLECYAGEEAGWAGPAFASTPRADLFPSWRTLRGLPKATQPWWSNGGNDYCRVRLTCQIAPCISACMAWCPYLIGHDGTYIVEVEVSSPMQKGPRAPGDIAVRGWVPGWCTDSGEKCGCADPGKYGINCHEDGTDACPRLTDCPAGGGCSVFLWSAGWKAEAGIFKRGVLYGHGVCDKSAIPADPDEYLKLGGESVKGRFEVEVKGGQQRGYVGVTLLLGAFAIPGPGTGAYSNIEGYVYCPSDEDFLIRVSVTKKDEPISQ